MFGNDPTEARASHSLYATPILRGGEQCVFDLQSQINNHKSTILLAPVPCSLPFVAAQARRQGRRDVRQPGTSQRTGDPEYEVLYGAAADKFFVARDRARTLTIY